MKNVILLKIIAQLVHKGPLDHRYSPVNALMDTMITKELLFLAKNVLLDAKFGRIISIFIKYISNN